MSQIYIERIKVTQPDPCYIKVDCSDSISMELWNKYSFLSPKARYDKRVRNRLWDGYLRLYNRATRRIYAGLKDSIKQYCLENRYEFIDETPRLKEKISLERFNEFIESLNLPKELHGLAFELRDYQFEGLRIAACLKRCILRSPTSSGKSLIMYLICRWFNLKTLMVVPTTTLVEQLAGDFADYGYKERVSQIYAGQDKVDLGLFTVSTWQSIHTMPKKWLQQFDVIIGDEAHGFAAKSLQTIMENIGAHIRIGTTGTLDDDAAAKVNKLVLQGLFGPIYRLTTTREMIDRGEATDVLIHAFDIGYDEKLRRQFKPRTVNKVLIKTEYPEEIEFLINHVPRNDFICELALSRKSNTLLLFKNIEHGKLLYEAIKARHTNTHLVYGEIETKERNEIRKLTEKSNDSIIIASYRTFATGINIRNLHHVILAAPIKTPILLIQAIGRVLRLSVGKDKAYIYDLGDNLSIGTYVNYAFKHFASRLEIYTKEAFEYKLTRIVL